MKIYHTSKRGLKIIFICCITWNVYFCSVIFLEYFSKMPLY